MTHLTEAHAGVKKNKPTDGSSRDTAVNNASLVYNPSVWTTEATVTPSLVGVLFFVRSLLYRYPFLALVWLVPFLEFGVAKVHQVSMLAMTEIAGCHRLDARRLPDPIPIRSLLEHVSCLC
jgi:hypothetical protein